MNAWKTRPLGELCEIRIGRTPARNEPRYWGEGAQWLSIADMSQGKYLHSTKEQVTGAAVDAVMGSALPVGTVVLSFKLSIGKVGITGVPMYTNEAIAALPIIDREALDEEFLYWALRTIDLTVETDDAAKGKTLNKPKLSRLAIPLPPRAEQQRIVDILDRIEGLREMRKKAIGLFDDLSHSIFLGMFGDPNANPCGWDVRPFGQLLQESPRNGLSPSNGATVMAKVLTLSAITGIRFNESAFKVSTFKSTPPTNQTVNELDFLVCRGNGNISLVGRGYFPTRDMPDTTFPDTMIAARVNTGTVVPEYLEYVWGTSAVRRQIEAAARTTNGTFKINQKALTGIELMVPPLPEQQRFASHVRVIQGVSEVHTAQLRTMAELTKTFQHRAFYGEL